MRKNSQFILYPYASQFGYMKSLFLDDNYDLIPYQICKEIKKLQPFELTPKYMKVTQLSLADSPVSFELLQAGFSNSYPPGVVCIKDARISRF